MYLLARRRSIECTDAADKCASFATLRLDDHTSLNFPLDDIGMLQKLKVVRMMAIIRPLIYDFSFANGLSRFHGVVWSVSHFTVNLLVGQC